ncbi:MAG: hypothetical protein H6Q74_107 [Firmicutes bacterium]|nr:hypothetical protein [Bacillota bacterium]
MMGLGLAIAAIAAYWVYNDAKGRGHDTGSAAMWAVGTFAFLIVCLPLYLIFGRKPNLRKRDEDAFDIEGCAVEELMHCSMCGGKVKIDFKACPYCGHTLKPKCEHCGRELEREWRICPYCQTPAPVK